MTPGTAQERRQAANDTSVVPHCRTCRCGAQKPAQRKSGGIRRTTADARFSTMIRERDNWTCQRCGRHYEPPTSALHCAHMFSRRIKATRVDPENAVALCYGCHQYLDSHPNEKLAFLRERLGDERFDQLEAKARGKRDRT